MLFRLNPLQVSCRMHAPAVLIKSPQIFRVPAQPRLNCSCSHGTSNSSNPDVVVVVTVEKHSHQKHTVLDTTNGNSEVSGTSERCKDSKEANNVKTKQTDIDDSDKSKSKKSTIYTSPDFKKHPNTPRILKTFFEVFSMLGIFGSSEFWNWEMVKTRAHTSSSFPTRIVNLLYNLCATRRRSEVHETLLLARKMHGAWFWGVATRRKNTCTYKSMLYTYMYNQPPRHPCSSLRSPEDFQGSFPKLSLKVPRKFPKQSHVELRFSLLRRRKKRRKRSSLRSVSTCATDSGGPAQDGRESEAKRMSLPPAPAPEKNTPASLTLRRWGL